MALDSAELMPDPFPQRSTLEQAPDSNALRVSTTTQHESGIPPARVRDERALHVGEQHLELALAEVNRTEANLGQLVRGLKHLAAGAAAAREANAALMHELDELRAHLVYSNEEEVALRFRMTQLEQMLDLIRHESARERDFLIEQQDLFLVEILSDHERQIAELRHSLRVPSAHQPDNGDLSELIAQRDQAREYATRCERERDLAWQALAGGLLSPAIPPAPTASDRKISPTPIAAIGLKSVPVSGSQPPPDTERHPTGYALSGDDVSK